ncbi:MAG: Na+/H+ antiporter subunit E [Candidatus Omnitrophica bacterium]|nr:Na+/H+ antiporter subunit E [Candidatus Omnitrophota bacterium]MBU1047312.1 Na+/H+ antiporter subunit E [Candidatus Omnitrophota bacterium]MBU1630424.1 Na+/H+ antiporter subunit E [Candidatus Omnitrophota bacterium]MBU1766477.1 Na+/H+ antiporter subunit E [Candidatus Omnitrophota bacterium]MBU1889103.1 Na+/H+ antiporter subunit E [Candidatus Omnitrophota bacterium]
MKSKLVLFVLGFLVWLLLSWVPDWQHIIVGVFVAILVAFVVGDLFITHRQVLYHPLRYWYFFACYLPLFLWECFKANIDVAYRVLHPDLPINPGIVKVKTSLRTDTALTFLANSITLTPGTLSVDIDVKSGFLYIHWIDVKAKDVDTATKIIVERFEKILKKIFE